MVSPADLKAERVIRAFERAGWENLGLKKGLALTLIKLAGLKWDEFERHYR